MKRFVRIVSAFLGILTLNGCAPSVHTSPSENDSSAANESAAGDTGISFSPEKAFAEVICPADEALKWAEDNPVVVNRDSVSGKEVWNAFFDAVSAGNPASVLCAHYYELHPESVSAELYEAEKDQYPVLYFYLVEYDGEEYHVRTRDSRKTTLDTAGTYAYLLHLTGENPPGALYRYTEEYDLVDDASVTWEQLQRSVYSSHSGDFIRHTPVYVDLHD